MSDAPDITIRQLGPDDAAAACDLVRRVFMATVAPLFKQEGIDEFLSYAAAEAMAQRLFGDNWGLAALDGQRVVGVVEARGDSHLAFFFVETAEQGRGIGKALIKRYLAGCLERAPALERVTVNASPNSRAIYQALGYQAQGPETEKNGIRFIPMALAMADARQQGLVRGRAA